VQHFDFSEEEAEREAKRLNPSIETIKLSSRTGDGMEPWISYVEQAYQSIKKE
jgi:hydrogenase nickel incorporation protein HypB